MNFMKESAVKKPSVGNLANKRLKPFPKNVPAVFRFQPTYYKTVETPEDLALWEQMMVEKVGLKMDFPTKPEGNRTPRLRRASPKTISKCGGDEWDMCDM
jgi:hypothetical protein